MLSVIGGGARGDEKPTLITLEDFLKQIPAQQNCAVTDDCVRAIISEELGGFLGTHSQSVLGYLKEFAGTKRFDKIRPDAWALKASIDVLRFCGFHDANGDAHEMSCVMIRVINEMKSLHAGRPSQFDVVIQDLPSVASAYRSPESFFGIKFGMPVTEQVASVRGRVNATGSVVEAEVAEAHIEITSYHEHAQSIYAMLGAWPRSKTRDALSSFATHERSIASNIKPTEATLDYCDSSANKEQCLRKLRASTPADMARLTATHWSKHVSVTHDLVPRGTFLVERMTATSRFIPDPTEDADAIQPDGCEEIGINEREEATYIARRSFASDVDFANGLIGAIERVKSGEESDGLRSLTSKVVRLCPSDLEMQLSQLIGKDSALVQSDAGPLILVGYVKHGGEHTLLEGAALRMLEHRYVRVRGTKAYPSLLRARQALEVELLF